MLRNKPWNVEAAQAWMIETANDLIEDGMFAAEGGRLLHEAKFNGGCNDHHTFVEVVHQILEWDWETIGETLDKLYA